ncbi:MAG: two-component regulator propeller domain-containing protein [Bacteroidota bacterium]
MKRLLLSSILILCLQTVFVNAQTYNFRNFTVENGLAQSQMLCVTQASNGVMWFGTNGGGIILYDGNKFQYLKEKDGLANNVVFSIVEAEGKMFIGTNGGLSIYDGKNFVNYTENDSIRKIDHNRVFKVIKDIKGLIWIGTQKGVYTYQNSKLTKFDKNKALLETPVFTMFCDSKNNIWFGTITNGAYVFDGNSVKNYSTKDSLSNNFVRTIIEDAKGTIWLGTASFLHKIVKGKLEAVWTEPGAKLVTFTSALLDKNKELWFGSQSGVYHYNGKKFKRYTIANGLISSNIYCVYQDKDLNYWFGSADQGLSMFTNELIKNFSKNDGLAYDAVQAVYQDSKGNFWIGSSEVGLSKFDGSDKATFQIYSKKLDTKGLSYNAQKQKEQDEKNFIWGFASQNCWGIEEDKNGVLYFATNNNGISILRDNKFKNLSTKDGLPDNKVFCIKVDKNNVIWIGTGKGVAKMVDERVVEEINSPLLKGISVYSIFHDKKGNIWFATDKGAVKFDGSTYTHFNEKRGLVDDRVRNIVQDAAGRYWFGTTHGIFVFDGSKFQLITEDEGLVSNNIYQLIQDNYGNIWAGTNKGVDKINYNVFNKFNKLQIKNYGKTDGFIGLECNLNAAFKDKKGRLWFGTIKGVNVINPALDKENKIQPITNITGVKYSLGEIDWTSYCDSIDAKTKLPINLVIPYSKNQLTFDYVGISLTVPEKVKYQYKLEPLNEEWYPVTSKNEAFFSNIPPGDYVFKVKACNNDGLWNTAPTEFKFTVLPPWYRTWWFYTLCVIIILGSFYLYITIKTRNLEIRQKVLEDQVSERTKELREEKEKVELINIEVYKQNEIIEHKNKDITDSINYAKRIQEALLPAIEGIEKGFTQAFVLFKPKDIVSGDFYWFAARGNKRFIAACDCTGHGVPGAFMSMIGNNLLNQIILENKVEQPGEILKQLNNGIKFAFNRSENQSNRNDGMDISLCVFDVETNKLEYAGAQRPMYYVRNGVLEEIKGTKNPIGGITPIDFEYINNVFDTLPGDAVYMSSDGYADQFGGENGKKFMTKRFKELILEIQQMSLEEQRHALDNNIMGWMGHHEQIDDVLVIGVKF